jgi:hypothetical protein
MRKIDLLKVAINKKYVFRGDEIKYLILTKFQEALQDKINPEILKATMNDKFFKFVEEQLDNYLAGKSINKEILTPIMNCADMFSCGGEITLHAGDYIALQTHFLQAGKR